MDYIARLTADHRVIGWLFVLALSIPPTLGFLGYQIAEPVIEDWVNPELLAELEEVQQTFRFNAPLVIVLKCDDFFTVERNTALHQTVAAIREMAVVKQVVWMGDVPEVTLRGRRVRQLLPEEPDDAAALEKAREDLLGHPLSSGKLISSNAKTAVLLVDIRHQKDVLPVRNIAVNGLQPYGIQAAATGLLALHELHDRTLDEDHFRIQMIAYVLVTLIAIVIFRRPVAMLVAGSGPITGVLWTLGWLRLIGQTENELAKIILPVLIMMIGFTDGMHIVIRLRQLRGQGKSPRDAVFQAISLIGPACLLTSVTTAIGFGSLMLSNSHVVAGFGRVATIGVVLTFLSVVLVIPLMANSWLGRRMHVSEHSDPLTVFTTKLSGVIDLSNRYARSFCIVGVVLTAAVLYTSLQLTPDDRLSDRVPQQAEECKTLREIDSQMGGIRYLRLLVSWTDDKTRNEIWPVVQQCEDVIRSEPLLGQATSIRSCLNVFRGPNVEDKSILVNQLPDELVEQFYRKDLKKTQIVARQQDLGIATFEPAFARLDAEVEKLRQANPGFEFRVISDLMIEGRVVRDMISELMRSLSVASVIIFAILAIAFRSVRVGLVSILPNIMPLACSGALRYSISESLGIASACSFAICLGIAVDDTIHYLTHFRHERNAGRSPLEANRNTFISIGGALFMTTVVMAVGLGSVLTSRMPPHQNFAAMGCATLLAALVADLLFLPALLALFPGRTPPADNKLSDVEVPSSAPRNPEVH